MTELSQEERERIYQEERAKLEAKKRIAYEDYAPRTRWRNPIRSCCFIWLILCFVIPAIYILITTIGHRR